MRSRTHCASTDCPRYHPVTSPGLSAPRPQQLGQQHLSRLCQALRGTSRLLRGWLDRAAEPPESFLENKGLEKQAGRARGAALQTRVPLPPAVRPLAPPLTVMLVGTQGTEHLTRLGQQHWNINVSLHLRDLTNLPCSTAVITALLNVPKRVAVLWAGPQGHLRGPRRWAHAPLRDSLVSASVSTNSFMWNRSRTSWE